MAITTCRACKRAYAAHRPLCPYCGALSAGQEPTNKGSGSARGVKDLVGKSMILVVALVALNLWQAATRDVGPNPAEEALHTPQEAIAQCLAGIESRFASQRPAIVEPLQTEYLGGGEYDVSGTVELVEGSLRARHDVSCTAQFDATDGWTADEILLDTK